MASKRYGELHTDKKVRTQRELVNDAIASLEALKSNTLNMRERKATLLSFPGAGVLKEAGIFKVDRSTCPQWVDEATNHIKSLVTTLEWDSLQNSGLLNSHYTSDGVIKVMWEYLAQFLKSGDTVLDPGCGTARFFQHKPREVQVNYVGVEKCPVACAIAKTAHEGLGAKFYEADFVRWSYPAYFDAVIGNVPFTDGNDWLKRDGEKLNIGLHAQFIFLSSLKLKPGGVMALLTSTSTLDARGKDCLKLRDHLARHCELLKVVRLPSNGNAHVGKTQVTTDLIILQKREMRRTEASVRTLSRKHPLQDAMNARWVESVDSGLTSPDGSYVVHVNEYFLNNPNSLIGVPTVSELRGKNNNPAYTFTLLSDSDTDISHELRLRLNNKQETKTMTTTNTDQDNAWFAFEVKYVDKKGSVPGCDAIQIHFPAKPSKIIRDALTKVGYSYQSNGANYWFAYLTPGIEKWTLNTLLAKYAPHGAKVTAAKVGETKVEPNESSSPFRIGDLFTMIREVSEIVKDVQQQQAATREDICEMRSQISTPVVDLGRIDELEKDILAKDAEIASVKLNVGKLEELLLEVKQEVELLTKERDSLENKCNEMEDTITLLRSDKEQSNKAHLDKMQKLQSQIDKWGLTSELQSQSLLDEDFPSLEEESDLPSLDEEESPIMKEEDEDEDVVGSWDELDESKND